MPPPPKRRKLSSTTSISTISKSTKYHKPITRPTSNPNSSTTKSTQSTEDPIYDPEARSDYLSGFRKRKQQRIKHAREEAAKKDRAAKIEARKVLRDQRQKDLESHVQAVNDILEKARDGDSDAEELEGESAVEGQVADGKDVEESALRAEIPRHEDEYIDEEKYTTVTIEPMDESADEEEEREEDSGDEIGEGAKEDSKSKARATVREIVMPDGTIKKKRIWTKEKPTAAKQKKKKVKKFRYESKIERKATRSKQRARNNDAAKLRREAAKS